VRITLLNQNLFIARFHPSSLTLGLLPCFLLRVAAIPSVIVLDWYPDSQHCKHLFEQGRAMTD
jgi:hypothetical protein